MRTEIRTGSGTPTGRSTRRDFEEFCQSHPQLVRRMKEARVPVGRKTLDCWPPTRTPWSPSCGTTASSRAGTRRAPRELNDRRTSSSRSFRTGRPAGDDAGTGLQGAARRSRAGRVHRRPRLVLAGQLRPCRRRTPETERANGSSTRTRSSTASRSGRATIIFRQGPPRAQSYVAERLTKEGWFDRDPWSIDDRLDEDRAWLPRTGPDGKPGRWPVRRRRTTAADAWREARRRWRDHGRPTACASSRDRLRQYLPAPSGTSRRHPGNHVGRPDRR